MTLTIRPGVIIRPNVTVKGFTSPTFKFDAETYTSGSTWYDSVSSKVATLYGDVTLTTGPKALNFTASGASEYGYIQVDQGVYFNHSFTAEGWVYVNSYANWSRLFDFGNGPADDNIMIAVSNGINGYPVFSCGGQNLVSNTLLPLEEWLHLSATYNYVNNTGTLYINGSQVAQSTMPRATQNVNRNYCYIGKSNWGGDANLEGSIGEFSIYPFDMTNSEVLAQYNTRKTHYGL
jgi:hypothetical protein